MVDLDKIKNIAVIGGGIMGSGIAQVALLTGYEKVSVIDLSSEILEKSRTLIQQRIKALESEVPTIERKLAFKKAESYFKLALKYALFGSDSVIIVTFGLIGSGKSTLAELLSEELSCEIVSSDIVRKKISGIPSKERKYEEYDSGIYSKDITERTYQELFDRAEEITKNGRPVILDASFSNRKWRE